MAKPKLTRTMMKAVVEASSSKGTGVLDRHPGGFWYAHNDHEAFGTNTVQGLVLRGVAEYDQWQDGRNGRFPVRVRLLKIAVPS